jgi:hypothetical protein
MTEWLIPWQHRGESGPVTDNFLWRSERLYVMDNHRLALWCWWQHLAESDQWNFVHIDRHHDALWQKFNPWPSHTRPDHRSDLAAFRNATVDCYGDPCALYRWDTITSALWSLHADQLLELRFATADEGDRLATSRAQHMKPWSVPGLMQYLAEPVDHLAFPTIVDIDIDYFARHDLDGAFGPVFSDEYIGEIGRALRVGLESGRFGVVTVALSPETTGSWSLAERLLATLLEHIDGSEDFFRSMP